MISQEKKIEKLTFGHCQVWHECFSPDDYSSECVQTRVGGAAMQLVKEQMSTWYSPSFWMNDLHSQQLGFLHQTWPTLIINDSVGQCPIFTAESSVMPGQTNPPQSFIIFNYCSHQSNRRETFICSIMAVESQEILLKCIYYISPLRLLCSHESCLDVEVYGLL